MTMIYIVRGCVEWEGSTVMAAFDTRARADEYIAEYLAYEVSRLGSEHTANYDWHDVVAVEVGATPFDYSDLAEHRR